MSNEIEWCVDCGVRPAKRLACGIPVYLPCETCLRESTCEILAGLEGWSEEFASMRVNTLLGNDYE